MEEVTVEEILEGIHNPAFASQRLPLLELLTNKLGESACSTIIPVGAHTDSKTEDSLSNIATPPATFATTMTNAELETLFKTLLTILEKTSCKTLQGRKIVNMSLCALSNSTITETQASVFLELTRNNNPGESIGETSTLNRQFHLMIRKYLEYNPQLEDGYAEDDDWIGVDEWQFGGNILTNLCQLEDGRKVILRQSTKYMESLPVQIRSRNPTRRRGAVGCIRSCLFDQDVHWWMLHDIKILTPILLPLVVPTPFTDKERDGMDLVLWMQSDNLDKKFEPELDIMGMLLDCVILLCQKRGLREELRKRKAYYVVRNLDLKIENETISEKIYEIVNFLMGDEDPSTPIDCYEGLLNGNV